MDRDKAEYDVFLSYDSREYDQIEIIARYLKEQGFKVFLDRWELPPGFSWQPEVERALVKSRAVAVFLGRYEMNVWQRAEKELALRRQGKEPTLPVIPVFLPGSESKLDILTSRQWVDFRTGLHDPKPRMLLAKAIRGESPGPDFKHRVAATLSSLCPYRGLKNFRIEDAPLFFGRDAFTKHLLAMVESHSFVAVLGPSGSGKSSVVQAGLVPLLQYGSNDQVWVVATMTPNDSPFYGLASALVPLLESELTGVDLLNEITRLADSFTSGVRLRDVVTLVLKKNSSADRVMLIVDQCEELFTLTPKSAQQTFLEELLDATASVPLSVVLTVRNDFYSRLVSHPPTAARLHDAKLDISDLTKDELAQVIERPAQVVGLRFEPGLIERMLDHIEGEPGKLPLLEFVLMELWKRREVERGELTNQAYKEMGELDGALAKHADAAFKALSGAEQETARRVFLQLVRVSADQNSPEAEPTRRRTLFSELDAEAVQVVRKLATNHLLVTGRNEATGVEVVDLVHEALIKGWDTLSKWIDEDREFLAWRERMRTYVNDAIRHNYHRDILLLGHRLKEATDWADMRWRDLSPGEQRLIKQSRQSRQIRIPVKPLFASVMVAILITATVFWLYGFKVDASPSTEQAKESVEKLQVLIGATTPRMNQPQKILILGQRPSADTVSEDRIEVVTLSGVDPNLSDRNYSLVRCINYVVPPDTKFVFAPVRLDSNMTSDLASVWNQLKDKQDKPKVLLAPDRFLDTETASRALQAANAEGMLVVIASQPGMKLLSEEQFMVVGSVNLEGKRSDFSPNDDGLFWAPGEGIVIQSQAGYITKNGSSYAAGIAAGVAVRILSRYPNLKPSQVIKVIRANSHPWVENGPPIINLSEALSNPAPIE